MKFITLGKLNLYTAGHRLISGFIKFGNSKGMYQQTLWFWFYHLEQTLYMYGTWENLKQNCRQFVHKKRDWYRFQDNLNILRLSQRKFYLKFILTFKQSVLLQKWLYTVPVLCPSLFSNFDHSRHWDIKTYHNKFHFLFQLSRFLSFYVFDKALTSNPQERLMIVFCSTWWIRKTALKISTSLCFHQFSDFLRFNIDSDKHQHKKLIHFMNSDSSYSKLSLVLQHCLYDTLNKLN